MIKRNSPKYRSLFLLGLVLVSVILFNIVAKFLFFRVDLTSEKRYTLSNVTKDMLKELDDVVYFKIYLEGEFPAGLKRLHDQTKEMLNEFKAYAGNNIEYEFINPLEGVDKKAERDVVKQLMDKGLQPTQLNFKEKEQATKQLVFPGAIVSFKGKETTVQLLKSQMAMHPEQVLNNSIRDLEYELSNSIRKLQGNEDNKIAFIVGHQELEDPYVADVTRALQEYYKVERTLINGQLNKLREYKAIIIAKPDSLFSEKDKFVIDQYVMNGGKVLWLVENTFASMDSLGTDGETIGISRSNNLEDMLFKYGVRVNTQFVQDIQGSPIPIVTGYMGNQPQTQLFPWYYFPLVFPVDKHPIVLNLNAIKFQFANVIDTVGPPSIKKTILLRTSKYARVMNTPARISLASVKQEPEEKDFNKGFLPLAVLLEGNFQSVFTNRIPSAISDSKEIKFKASCDKPGKMIVIADGDVIKNDFNESKQTLFPLGFDKYTKETYGNKNFILNAVNYLCDDDDLISVRARELKLRLLDKTKIQKEATKWKTLNVILPIALIVSLGFWLNKRRKNKYSK